MPLIIHPLRQFVHHDHPDFIQIRNCESIIYIIKEASFFPNSTRSPTPSGRKIFTPFLKNQECQRYQLSPNRATRILRLACDVELNTHSNWARQVRKAFRSSVWTIRIGGKYTLSVPCAWFFVHDMQEDIRNWFVLIQIRLLIHAKVQPRQKENSWTPAPIGG